MFDLKTIDNLKANSPEFQNLKLDFKGNKIETSLYDLVNYHIISTNVINHLRDRITVLHPADSLFDLLFVTFLGLSHIKKNIVENLSPENIKLNQCVVIKSEIENSITARGLYEGFEEGTPGLLSEGKYHRIGYLEGPRKKNPTHSLIHENDFNRFYSSPSSKDKFPVDLSSEHVREDIIKRIEVLNQIFGNVSEDKTLYEQKGILVVASKNKLVESMPLLHVNNMPLTDLFSIAYYDTCDNPDRLGSDLTEREYSIHLTSNMSVANEILKQNPKIKTLIICGNEKLKHDSSILQSIMTQRDNIEDIYTLLDIRDCDAALELEKGHNSFDTWFWQKEDLVELKEVQNEINNSLTLSELHKNFQESDSLLRRSELLLFNDNQSEQVFQHGSILHKASSLSHVLEEISYPVPLQSVSVTELKRQIKRIKTISSALEIKELYLLISKVLKLIYLLLGLPFGVSNFDEIIKQGKNTSRTIRGLYDDIEIFINNLDLNKTPEELIEGTISVNKLMAELVDSFYNHSGKLQSIIKLVEKFPENKIYIVVRNPDFEVDYKKNLEEMLKRLLSERLYNNIKIKNLNELTDFDSYDLIIFTYFTSDHLNPIVFENSYGNKISLFYASESEDYNQRKKASYKMLRKINKSDIKAILINIYKDSHNEEMKDILLFNEEDTLLGSINESLHEYIKKQDFTCSSDGNNIEAISLVFDDGCYTFVEKGKTVKVLDKEKQNYTDVPLNKLTPGDNIIFLDDSRKEIFRELVNVAMEKEFIQRDVIDYSNLWKSSLKTFVKKNNVKFAALQSILQKQGVERTVQTIKTWLEDDNIIGPPEDNYKAIDAIAKITKDSTLGSSIAYVKASCSTMHGIHNKLGKCLVWKLLNPDIPMNGKEAELFSKLNDRLSELAGCIKILKLSDILHEAKEVSPYYINKLRYY